MNVMNNLYAFILGRETKIALLELESVLRRFCFDFHLDFGREVSVLSVVDNIAIIKIEPRGSFAQIDTDNPTDNNSDKLDIGGANSAPKGPLFEGANEVRKLMKFLGGTVKIFEIVAKGSNNLINDIANIVKENTVDMTGKLNLGISDYRPNPTTTNNINKIGLSVKNILKKSHNTRFVAVKEGNELASIVSYKNKLDSKGIEIGIFQAGIGRLVAVTNPEEWSKRDYDKPKGDKYSGMTPPKLARALVNIALSQAISNDQFPISNENSKIDKLNAPSQRGPFSKNCEFPPAGEAGKIENYNDSVVVDPFCGSGNILMEAAMLGCNIIGSDISEKAVEDTKTNLNWLHQNFQIANSNNQNPVFQADATRYDFSQIFTSDAVKNFFIVTEPYLGQPKKFEPSMNAVKGEYQKIKKLYIDFLQNLKYSNPKGAPVGGGDNLEVICVIFPLVETQEGKQYSLLNECIDEIKEMGYTLVCEPMVYGREYQVVKRQIVFFKIQ